MLRPAQSLHADRNPSADQKATLKMRHRASTMAIFLQLLCAAGSADALAGGHHLLEWGRKFTGSLRIGEAADSTDTCADNPARGVVHGGVRLPDLLVEAVFNSKAARSPRDVTLVTQLSANR